MSPVGFLHNLDGWQMRRLKIVNTVKCIDVLWDQILIGVSYEDQFVRISL
jgi:hypothetical protein